MANDGRYRRRDLLLANGAALVLLAVVLAVGWWEAAAFGLAVLLVMDLLVFARAWTGRPKGE